MLRSLTWTLLGLVAGAAAFGGCSCENRVQPGNTPVRISIIFPEEGAVIVSTDDVNASAGGIQVHVIAEVEGVADGATLVLSNSVDRDANGFPTPTTASAAGGRVTFSGYSLPLSAVVAGELEPVRLRLAQEGVSQDARCDGSSCAEISITVVETACDFVAPHDGDILTADLYVDAANPFDPFESDVVVDCKGVAAGDWVALRVNDGRPVVAQSDGRWPLTFARVALSEGPNKLSVAPRTDAAGQNAAGAAVEATVRVSTGRCTATLSPPDGSILNAADDVDLDNSNGLQAAVDLVTDCAASSTVRLYVNPDPPGSLGLAYEGTPQTQPDQNGVRFRIPSVNLPETLDPLTAPYSVRLVGSVEEGSGGRSGTSLPADYWVDSRPPELRSFSPGAGACVAPAQDTNSALAGLQLTLFGTTGGAPAGAEVWARVGVAGETPTPCALDADCEVPELCRGEGSERVCHWVGTVSAADTFQISDVTMPVGDLTIEYIAHDLAGNEARSGLLALRAVDQSPTVSITRPAADAVLTSADDLDTARAGVQYQVGVDVSDVPAGTLGALTISGQTPVAFVPPAGPSASATIDVTLEDGARTLVARVQDFCGNTVESAPVSLTAFSAEAIWLATAYESSASGFDNGPELQSGGLSGAGAIDIDNVVSTSLYDRTLTVRRYDGYDAGSGSCSGTATVVSTSSVLASSTGAAVNDLALVEGNNCFLLELDDGLLPQQRTIFIVRRTAPLGLAFVDPDPLLQPVALTVDSDPLTAGFNYDVRVRLGAVDPFPGTLELSIGAFNQIVVSLPGGQQDVTIADAGLPDGSYLLTAVYTDSGGTVSASAPVAVSVDSGRAGPDVVIVAPQSGAAVGGAFAVQVQRVDTTAGEAPSLCRLFEGGTLQSGDVAWGAEPVAITPSPALAEGQHLLHVECDGASGTGISQAITVELDATPPADPSFVDESAGTPGRLIFDSSGRFINGLVADTSSLVGVQHPITIAVDTSGAGSSDWQVELVVTPAAGAPRTYARMLSGAADPQLTVSNVDLGAAAGPVTLELTSFDRAGNASNAVTASFTFDRTPPTLTQSTPNGAWTVISRPEDANTFTPAIDVSFSYAAGGVADGTEVLLQIDPTPLSQEGTGPLASSDFPLRQAVSGGSARFANLAFADGPYFATATLSDAAGNLASRSHAFEILTAPPDLAFLLPSLPGGLNQTHDRLSTPGLQALIRILATGFGGDTPLKLCSSMPPPGGPGSAEECRYGFPAGYDTSSASQHTGAEIHVAGSRERPLLRGWVIGTTPLVGGPAEAIGTFDNISLADGEHWLHAEAVEVDLFPDESSPFFRFVVDTTPPTITALTLSGNNPANDRASPPLVRMGAGEGSAGAGQLSTSIAVTTSGVEDGRTLRLYSTLPAAGTLVGQGSVNGNSVTITATLVQGEQTITAVVTDAAGNPQSAASQAATAATVLVDVGIGTVVVSPPDGSAAGGIYSSADGVIDPGADATGRADDSLVLDAARSITVSISNEPSLEGSSVTLERYGMPSGGTALASMSAGPLGPTQSQVGFSGFALPAGVSYLQVRVVDALGNTGTTARSAFRADFHGPLLGLAGVTAAGTPLVCTQGSPCVADILDPAANNNRALLDATGTDGYCPPGFPCSAVGTDLAFTLTECANAAGVEDCSTQPASVWLEDRIDPSGGAFATVAQSSWAAAADVAGASSYAARAPGLSFGPALVREVRIAAMDAHGNLAYSPSVFLQLDVAGLLVDLERVGAAGPSGELLPAGLPWGPAENLCAAPAFCTDLRVHVTRVPPAQSPTDVELLVDGSTEGVQALVGDQADYAAVALPANTPSTIDVVILCSGVVCGGNSYVDVVADLRAPEFEFDRNSLCALGVPLADIGACANLATSNTNIAPPSDRVAQWSLAGDQNSDPSAFSILPTGTPLVLLVYDVEPGQLVTLSTNRSGGLGGGDSASFSIAESDCAGGVCRVDLAPFELAGLAGSLTHRLSVSVSDEAGNAAVPVLGRGEEAIYAAVDLVRPSPVQPTVCVGESTGAGAGQEPGACTALCASSGSCSRLGGEVTLSWTAPADDAASGDPVVSYRVAAVARGVTYCPAEAGALCSSTSSTPRALYASCAAVLQSGFVEQEVTMPASVAPGSGEVAVLGDLYPHRAYCFFVEAIDDAGNVSLVGASEVRERQLPLLSYPTAGIFDPGTPGDDQGSALLTDSTGNADFGESLVSLGDFDGDGRNDFGVTRDDSTAFGSDASQLWLFLSRSSAPVVLREQAANTVLGYGLAGGDFDGDGLADFAVCAPGTTNTTGGAFAGALHIYYGSTDTDAAGQRWDPSGAPPSDQRLPRFAPGVSIYGPTGAFFCGSLSAANLDAAGTADLVIADALSPGRVFGFRNPALSRFSGTSVQLSSGIPALGGDHPDFAFASPVASPVRFPAGLAAVDLDGDGADELAVSDYGKSYDQPPGPPIEAYGEVYVFGSLATTPSLRWTLRYPAGQNFGQTMVSVRRAREGTGSSPDLADWLLVHAPISGANQVVVFKGITGTGLSPSSFPLAAAADYVALSSRDWDGSPIARFGWSMSEIGRFDGHGGKDILIGGGNAAAPGAPGAVLLSYDADADAFTQRVVLRGAGGGFGAFVGGAGPHLLVGAPPQLLVVSSTAHALYLFH